MVAGLVLPYGAPEETAGWAVPSHNVEVADGPSAARVGTTFVKGRIWIASLVLVVPLATACSGSDQHSAAPLSCGSAAHSLKPPNMPTLGKFTAELSFNGDGNGFVFSPPSNGVRPLVSASQAWKAVLPLAPGTYRFVLANRSDYNPYPGTVLDWVLMDIGVPSVVAPPDSRARPFCTYLDGVTAVNATTGGIDLSMGFSPSLAEVPRILTCRHQSAARGGPSCRWRIAQWPWGAR